MNFKFRGPVGVLYYDSTVYAQYFKVLSMEDDTIVKWIMRLG